MSQSFENLSAKANLLLDKISRLEDRHAQLVSEVGSNIKELKSMKTLAQAGIIAARYLQHYKAKTTKTRREFHDDIVETKAAIKAAYKERKNVLDCIASLPKEPDINTSEIQDSLKQAIVSLNAYDTATAKMLVSKALAELLEI